MNNCAYNDSIIHDLIKRQALIKYFLGRYSIIVAVLNSLFFTFLFVRHESSWDRDEDLRLLWRHTLTSPNRVKERSIGNWREFGISLFKVYFEILYDSTYTVKSVIIANSLAGHATLAFPKGGHCQCKFVLNSRVSIKESSCSNVWISKKTSNKFAVASRTKKKDWTN